MEAYQAKHNFIVDCYGSKEAYLQARKEDYCKAQLVWSEYMDGLCKDGLISETVWKNMTF